MPTTTCTRATLDTIASAAAHLRAGGLVILPTDTVYGLFADASNDEAVRAIATAKGKPGGTPLQLLFPRSGEGLSAYAVVTDTVRRFIDDMGPGPWSLVVPAAPGWDSPALAGGETVGFRLPNHDVLDAVIEVLGGPICGSSANAHGEPGPATCEDAVAGVGEHAAVALEGGTAAGLSSTVIDLSGDEPVILREGVMDREQVARILGLPRIEVVRSEREGDPR